GLVHQLQMRVNETTRLLAVAESRVERLEVRFRHVRGHIHMLQERLADQWEEPIAVAPLRMERPGERCRRSQSSP
ncbi:hypothetical protein KI387_000119, partial [Taxus chinensis]